MVWSRPTQSLLQSTCRQGPGDGVNLVCDFVNTKSDEILNELFTETSGTFR